VTRKTTHLDLAEHDESGEDLFLIRAAASGFPFGEGLLHALLGLLLEVIGRLCMRQEARNAKDRQRIDSLAGREEKKSWTKRKGRKRRRKRTFPWITSICEMHRSPGKDAHHLRYRNRNELS
jgi:hypothetical protein